MIIEKGLVSQMVEHAKREAPKEACGILAGKGERVRKVFECKNRDDSPFYAYTISPGELLKKIDEIEAGGLDVIGFYHSHPMGLEKPSAVDVSRATWPGHSYVIVSLPGGVKISSWEWDEVKDRFIEEEIKEI
jgi:desampylase